MRSAAVLFVAALAGAWVLGFAGAGPGRTFGDDIQVSMPKEAEGFSGTLSGVSAKPSGNGWCTIKVVKVLSFDAKNRSKLSVDALTAVWKGKYVAAGPADPKNGPPLPDMKVGDGIIVTAHQNEMHLRYTKVAVFMPGEDEPDCYAFLKKEEKGNKVALTLRKMGEEKTVTLALEKAHDDKMVPKADLLKTVNELAADAVVIVKLDHNTLKDIKPYEAPKKGEFVKVTTAKVGDKTLPAAEIKDDAGASQTLPFLPGDSSEISKEARAFKAGASVFYRTETDDKGTWLARIWSAS